MYNVYEVILSHLKVHAPVTQGFSHLHNLLLSTATKQSSPTVSYIECAARSCHLRYAIMALRQGNMYVLMCSVSIYTSTYLCNKALYIRLEGWNTLEHVQKETIFFIHITGCLIGMYLQRYVQFDYCHYIDTILPISTQSVYRSC